MLASNLFPKIFSKHMRITYTILTERALMIHTQVINIQLHTRLCASLLMPNIWQRRIRVILGK